MVHDKAHQSRRSTVKLYYAPGACSLAPHIISRELGLPVSLTRVDLGTRRTEDGRDYTSINPKGYVPALELEGGEVLTEAAAILQFLVDQAPGLARAQGTLTRYRFIEWLTFISSEIHKGFGPHWNPATPEEARVATVGKLNQRFVYLDQHLSGRPFLLEEGFTAADAYLFTVVSWAGILKVDLTAFPHLEAYLRRVSARPAVQAALRAEGLVKEAA
jgi:glutathione S-transferase